MRFIRRFAQVWIDGNKKTVHLRDDPVGEKGRPAAQKLVKFLLANSVIDNSWKITASDIGEHLRGGWKTFAPSVAGKTPEELVAQEPFTRAVSELYLYHGTSEKDWEKVQRFGALVPLFTGSAQTYGFESRTKHRGNVGHIYLTGTQKAAWEYAKTRSADINRKENPEKWKTAQYRSACERDIKPILLGVQIPDVSKLRADDDEVNRLLRKAGDRIWEKKSPEEREAIKKEVGQKDDSIARMVWRETDKGWKQILAKLPMRAYKAWFSTLQQQDQVAYKGIIPIKFISHIPICD
jgi:hypothetical protein